MAAPDNRIQRGGALDALRFFAAAFIVAFHLGDDAPAPLRALHPAFGRGYLATDFFLMLSGFVLASIYGEQVLAGRVSPGQFLLRRFARNYPAHITNLAALVAMVLAAGAIGHPLSNPERFQWSALPYHLLMAHGWGLAPDSWNVPTWTISALMLCYAGFPWLWAGFNRLAGAGAALAVTLAILLAGDLVARTVAGQPLFALPFPWGLLRAVPLFLTGLGLARLVQTLPSGRWSGPAALAGAGILAVNVAVGGPDLVSLLAIGTVIVGCGAMRDGPRWPGAAWGARLSFSLFFTHTPADALYNDAVRPLLLKLGGEGMAWRWEVWWGGLAFALAAALAYQHLIDEPLQKRLRPLLFRGSPARRPVLAPSA
jgi:peptidoglycan/LPS O-acetylase OafA/YrhL